MKRFFKRIISILLVMTLFFSVAPLSNKTITAQAQSAYLSDEYLARFINLFYVPGSEAAQAVENILNGQSDGTAEDIEDICSNIALFLGVASDVSIDNMTVNSLSDISVIANAIVGVFNIIDNYEQMQNTESALKKTVDGLQITVSLLQIINLGSYISPSVSMALSTIDVTMNIASYIEIQNIKEAVELYRAELMIDYYAGNELTFKTAPNVSGLGISQEEADSLYSAAYFEWYFKQCMDRIGNSSESGTGGNTEEKPVYVESVSFATGSYTMFLNYSLTNTAKAYPTDADDTSITYYSANTAIATVNSKGEVTPVSPGKVDIVAESSNGIYDICKLTILPYTAEINDEKITILSYEGNESAVTIPKSVNGNYVVEIGDSAFKNCTDITSVTIPNSVTSIGGYAFYNCTSLTNIKIPDSVTSIGGDAFRGCTSLTSITIPDSVTSIGGYAFYNCTSLTNIKIPDSVTFIGDRAFYGCKCLTSITIPDSVTRIDDYTFYGCESLASITIPDSVTSIGRCAFYKCTSLKNITIPDSVASIGDNAFIYCENLTISRIPDSLTSIGECAFFCCYNLSSVTIPNSVTSIGNMAFANCTSITNITVDNANEYYSSDEYGVLYNKDKTTLIQYPVGNSRTSYEISDNVTQIGAYAFVNCNSLERITIPASLMQIANGGAFNVVHAFSCCINLTNITVDTANDYYSSDEHGVLYNKDKTTLIQYPVGNTRTSYEIPDSVTSIGHYAFYSCNNLTDIYFAGNENEWDIIGKGLYNECLQNIRIHYNHIHNYSETVVVSAKCLTDGEGYGTCICGQKTENYAILANGHTSGKWEVIAEATCTTVGEKVKKCTACGEVVETEGIAVIDHTAGEWEVIAVATCTAVGEKVKKCTACGIVVEKEIIPFDAHNDENSDGLCDDCDKISNIVLVKDIYISIATPKNRTINYMESVKLYATTANLPEGYKIKWKVEGEGVSIKPSTNGKTCTVTSTSTGNVVVKAYIVDSNGSIVTDKNGKQVTDSEYFYSEANFWLRIVYFFEKLFGLTKTIPQVFRRIF